MQELVSALALMAVLLVSVGTDVRSRRIPNALIVIGLATALALGGLTGWQALGNAVAGLIVGLLLFLPAYVFALMGAGDVKLMAVVGAFLGPMDVVLAAVASVIAGGILGLMVVMGCGGGRSMLQRYRLMLACLWATGRFAYVKPAAGEAAAKPMPYALAIACGTTWTLWQQSAAFG